jgi:hypothetical protein
MAVMLAAALAVAPQRVFAFKWHSCPAPPLPVYPSALGATKSPFIHPGHELTIVLNQDEVAQTGGFSVLPNSNTITIVFESLFGPPIQLPMRSATAASDSVLTFTFPDTRDEIHTPLVGPVRIEVSAEGRSAARILGSDLVALPPFNDIASLVLSEVRTQIALAALDANGDLWVPTRFQGEPMVMPMCPGDFIVPQPVAVGGAMIIGDTPNPYNPLARIRGMSGYLGDLEINGTSFYGWLVDQPIELVHVQNTLGVSICRLNDAIDLVLRVQGDKSWAQDSASPFRVAAANSAPVMLMLQGAPVCPTPNDSATMPATAGRDSFGNLCGLDAGQ